MGDKELMDSAAIESFGEDEDENHNIQKDPTLNTDSDDSGREISEEDQQDDEDKGVEIESEDIQTNPTMADDIEEILDTPYDENKDDKLAADMDEGECENVADGDDEEKTKDMEVEENLEENQLNPGQIQDEEEGKENTDENQKTEDEITDENQKKTDDEIIDENQKKTDDEITDENQKKTDDEITDENQTMTDEGDETIKDEHDREGTVEEKQNNEETPGEDKPEEEQEPPEMTQEEKKEYFQKLTRMYGTKRKLLKAMYEAVKQGDVDLLDDLMDLPGADINMEWFGENLLMTACRFQQQSMAEFLIDNGVNYNFSLCRMEKSTAPGVEWDVYRATCRDVAYECEMWDVIEILDALSGDLWYFVKPKPRTPRLKKPLEEKMKERGEWIEEEELDVPNGEDEEENGEEDIVDGGSKENDETASCDKTRSVGKKSTLSRGAPKGVTYGMDFMDLDDASSGYDSMSDSAPSQSTIRIICNLNDQVTLPPQRHYHGNKVFLSRKKTSAKYKTAMDERQHTTTSSPSDCLTNIVWHTDVKPTKPKKQNVQMPRLISPWKNDDPVFRSELQSRAKSAQEAAGTYNRRENTWSRDRNSLPNIQSKITAGNLGPVNRTDSNVLKKAPGSSKPKRYTQTLSSRSLDSLKPSVLRLSPSSMEFTSKSSCSFRSMTDRTASRCQTSGWTSPEFHPATKKNSPAGFKKAYSNPNAFFVTQPKKTARNRDYVKAW